MQTALNADAIPTRTLYRSQRIALSPNKRQTEYFEKACGVARFAYNWALTEWERQYKLGGKPSANELNKTLNAIKHAQFPWMAEVTSFAPEAAINNLHKAYRKFWAKKASLPRFKKKGVTRDSFLAARRITRQENAVEVEGKRVLLPRVGWVRMRSALRYSVSKILFATVTRTAERWFVTLVVRVESPMLERCEGRVVGVDLGTTTLATMSDGSTFEGPHALKVNLKRMQRLCRGLSRKQRGSSNRKKAARRLARLHARISNIRHDSTNKLTCHLAREYKCVVVEDLNVRGMQKHKRLARSLMDSAMGMFRRQLIYKAEERGTRIVTADRWFASTKMCSGCGLKKDEVGLKERVFACSCGVSMDRDLNAARNLEKLAGSSSVSACGAVGL